jgi:DNA-directed RNA polymerase subunit N (RpoN/RPB10)
MYPYIRCFCGRPLAHLYSAFLLMCKKHNADARRANEPIGYILDSLGIVNECCRVRMMTGTEFKNYYNRVGVLMPLPHTGSPKTNSS